MKRSPLKSDPAKVAAFVQRGRENGPRRATAPGDFRDDAGRVLPARVNPLARAPRRATPKVPTNARRVALARSGGKCVMCLHLGRRTRATQAHHVWPKSKWPALLKVAANLVGLCADCHAKHEGGSHRLPLATLPAETIALADGDGPMTNYLARTYRA